MKNTNAAQKTSPQTASQSHDSARTSQTTSAHIKIVKPRPSSTEVATAQGPRGCIPLG